MTTASSMMTTAELRDLYVDSVRYDAGLSPAPDSRKILRAVEERMDSSPEAQRRFELQYGKLARAEEELAGLYEEIEEKQALLRKLGANLAVLEKELARLALEKKEMAPSGECPTCGRSM